MFIGLRKCGDEDGDGNAVLTVDKNRRGRKFQVRARVRWECQRFSDVNDTYEIPRVTGNPTARQICGPGDKSADHPTNPDAYKVLRYV